jgi:hypothetical protein
MPFIRPFGHSGDPGTDPFRADDRTQRLTHLATTVGPLRLRNNAQPGNYTTPRDATKCRHDRIGLGHSSVPITSDSYSHLIGAASRQAAENAAALVPSLSGSAHTLHTPAENRPVKQPQKVTTTP